MRSSARAEEKPSTHDRRFAFHQHGTGGLWHRRYFTDHCGAGCRRPDEGRSQYHLGSRRSRVSWTWYARTYAISLSAILALGLLLAISLIITTALTAVAVWLGMQSQSNALWQILNTVLSIATLTLLFAFLFRYFPDTTVSWREVWFGALITSLLFEAGKIAISLYIATQAIESTYGAAGSFVVLLIWVYYSSQIVLFGAELTRAWSTASSI